MHIPLNHAFFWLIIYLRDSSVLFIGCLMPHYIGVLSCTQLALCRWTFRLFSFVVIVSVGVSNQVQSSFCIPGEYFCTYTLSILKEYAFVFLTDISSLLHVTEFHT